MKIIYPSFYKDFKCIAGECPDSCCQGWEVDADPESLDYYRSLPEMLPVRKKIFSVLARDEYGNDIFTLTPDKRCPFLNCNNLCDMHIAIGGEHTPLTCRRFPRFIYDFGSAREIGVSFSCPVAADMIFDLKNHMTFDSETSDEPPALNDIDGLLYYRLKALRTAVINALQDDSAPLSVRLITALDLSASFQDDISPYPEGGNKIDFFDVFNNPEVINPEWSERVKNGKLISVENSLFNENIAVSFVWKYFLQSVFDRDVLSKMKIAVVAVLINTYFGNSAWTVHLWSKETEHSQVNMDRFKSLLRSADCLSAKNLKKLLII